MKNKNRNRTKNDLLLVFVILCLALFMLILSFVFAKEYAGNVQIKVDGKLVGTYPIYEDKEIVVNGGSNIVTINSGRVQMREANCPDQICVNHHPIHANHESIICLPNKVVVEVTSKEIKKLDGMTN